MTIRSCDDPPEVPPFDVIFSPPTRELWECWCDGMAEADLCIGQTYTAVRAEEWKGFTFYHLEHHSEQSFHADLFRIVTSKPC